VNRPNSRRLLFAVFVVLALAAIYAAAGLRHPVAAAGNPATPAGKADVISALRACAAPGSSGVDGGSLAIAAMPGSASAGAAVVTRLVPGGSATAGQVVATVTRPGLLQLTGVKTAAPLTKALQAGQPGSSANVSTVAGRGGVVVSASGVMAQGLAVEQTGPGGLVTAQCGSPGTSFWFVGPGQAATADIELYLMNTDSQAADVEVTAITDVTKGGPILGNADNGITVPPHSMVTQSLGGLLQSSKVVALNVSSSVGRVVAAVRESKSGANDGSWLPATQAPARHLVIPGLPSSSGTRELYIAVPGTATAQVKITAVTPRGSYQPTGGAGIDLLGGSAAAIPLPALGGVAGAVRISASIPVAATMVVSGGPPGAAGALAVATGPVQQQGVLSDSPAGSAGSTDLVLSAPGKAASVRITVGTASAPASSQAGTVVQVKAGGTMVVPVKAPAGHRIDAVMIVVTPLAGSGPVYAGQVISYRGVVRSILPVASSLTWISLPAVPSSLSVVAP
jgi:hypothetical protein